MFLIIAVSIIALFLYNNNLVSLNELITSKNLKNNDIVYKLNNASSIAVQEYRLKECDILGKEHQKFHWSNGRFNCYTRKQ